MPLTWCVKTFVLNACLLRSSFVLKICPVTSFHCFRRRRKWTRLRGRITSNPYQSNQSGQWSFVGSTAVEFWYTTWSSTGQEKDIFQKGLFHVVTSSQFPTKISWKEKRRLVLDDPACSWTYWLLLILFTARASASIRRCTGHEADSFYWAVDENLRGYRHDAEGFSGLHEA